MNSFNCHKASLSASALLSLLVLAGLSISNAETKGVTLGGAGWMQYGLIGHSQDSTLTKKSIYQSGAQLSLDANLSEELKVQAALGVAAGHSLAGSVNSAGGYAPFGVGPYVANAYFSYAFTKSEESNVYIKGGLFPYDYNPDVHNLGLYLLRGPVYPGFLISSFENKAVLPIANTMGLQFHVNFGQMSNDLIISSDVEFLPYFDISPAYITSYQFGKTFRLGGGVNFYHWIEADKKLVKFLNENAADTLDLPFKGIKLMANASFDAKALFGYNEIFGSEDLKIYSEVALLGIKNDSIYKEVFGDNLHRMPIMFGFNIPAFKYLDKLSIETEWYGAKFKDDLTQFDHTAGNKPSAKTVLKPNENNKRDNWKWSLYASKVIQQHFKLSLQVANDHYRPGVYTGDGDNHPPSSSTVTNTPEDWYAMLKLAYFF